MLQTVANTVNYYSNHFQENKKNAITSILHVVYQHYYL